MEHRITSCTTGQLKGTECRQGFELIDRLRAAIAQAGDAIPGTFEMSGVACIAGGDHPFTVAYHASRNATYLFGDTDLKADIEDIVASALQYASLHDGSYASGRRHGNMRATTLERVPAAFLTIEETQARAL